MDSGVVSLTTVSAPVSALTSAGSMSNSQTVGAEVPGLDVAQPLGHSVPKPLGTDVQWVLLWFTESTLPFVTGGRSHHMHVASLILGMMILFLVCPPG